MKQLLFIQDVREYRWREPAKTWGLVPTMGFLHEGHISLVRRARRDNEKVGVSIFVNPTQFNNASDLENYPSNRARDLALLEKEGVDLVWTPTPEVVYPRIETVKEARVDYVSVAHPETLEELERIETESLISLAVFMGDVRLIDNIKIATKNLTNEGLSE